MPRPKLVSLAAIVFAALTSTQATATGRYTCESGDRSTWKTMEELESKMIAEGWQVRRIKEDGNCYEAYGTSPQGERVEAYFHPVTLELHLKARRGQILFRKAD